MKSSDVTAKEEFMAKISIRGNKLYLDYKNGSKRIQRSTGLNNTKDNIAYLNKVVIPELQYKLSIGDLAKPKDQTFSSYYKKWLVTKESNRGYFSRISQYTKVNQYFGDMSISSIKRSDIKNYMFNLDMQNNSKAPYLNCISGVLDMALDDEIIDRNVAYGIKLGATDRKKIEPFSKKEVFVLLSESKGMMKNYLGVAFHTGMRPSEILGLQHKDIGNNSIRISRSVTKGRLGKTKNKSSTRVIPMFNDAKQYFDVQMKQSKSFYIFEQSGEHIYGADYFSKRFRDLCKKVGIKYRSLYNTRHTFATTMLNSGEFRIMDIAAILGHTNAKMIMTTYAGFIEGDHLKIDTSFNLFCDSSVTLGTQHA